MSTFKRRALLILGLLLLGGGCNPLLLPYFLFPEESKLPVEYHKLAADDNKKEVRAVILTYMGMNMNTDMQHADRDLSVLLAKELQALCRHNEENVTLVNPLRVEEYKNSHPDWHQNYVDLAKIGRHFHADYVIYLEIDSMTMYQPGTAGQLYRGVANLTLSLVDVNNPDDFTKSPKKIPFTYPSDARGGSIPVDMDTPPDVFKEKFFTALAKKLAGNFSACPTSQHNWSD